MMRSDDVEMTRGRVLAWTIADADDEQVVTISVELPLDRAILLIGRRVLIVADPDDPEPEQ